MRRLLLGAAAAAVALSSVTACGDDDRDPPKELSSALSRVDKALVARDFTTARRALTDLVAATRRAQDSGHLDHRQEQQVLQAAATLTSALPTPKPVVVATPKPTRTAVERPRERKKKHRKHEEGDDD